MQFRPFNSKSSFRPFPFHVFSLGCLFGFVLFFWWWVPFFAVPICGRFSARFASIPTPAKSPERRTGKDINKKKEKITGRPTG
jgi:hypothetical protein